VVAEEVAEEVAVEGEVVVAGSEVAVVAVGSAGEGEGEGEGEGALEDVVEEALEVVATRSEHPAE
jgi:hypothetical protein